MFHRLRKEPPLKRIIYSLLIGFGVIGFWRGAWGLLDTYLLPENLELSYWISLVVGLVILYLTHHLTKELA